MDNAYSLSVIFQQSKYQIYRHEIKTDEIYIAKLRELPLTYPYYPQRFQISTEYERLYTDCIFSEGYAYEDMLDLSISYVKKNYTFAPILFGPLYKQKFCSVEEMYTGNNIFVEFNDVYLGRICDAL